MSHKKKIGFIINPISGTGRQKKTEKLVADFLDTASFDPVLVYTEGPKHATMLAGNAARENFDVVVAVGGDGSVNEVAKGLIGSNTAMAILPAGSGNGLARHLNIPLDLEKAMLLIQKGVQKKMDTIHFNRECFLNVAGVGFDAHIGWEFSRFGKRGFAAYLQVILRELAALKTQPFELIIDGRSIHREAYLISFANGTQWGNNAYIAPLADTSDGLMEVVILKKFPLWLAISIVYKLFTKQLHTASAVETIRTKKMTIRQTGTIAHIDGEPIECGRTIMVEVNPLSLNVIVPA